MLHGVLPGPRQQATLSIPEQPTITGHPDLSPYEDLKLKTR